MVSASWFKCLSRCRPMSMKYQTRLITAFVGAGRRYARARFESEPTCLPLVRSVTAKLVERQEAIIYFQAKRAQCGGINPPAELRPGTDRIPASREITGRALFGNEDFPHGLVPRLPSGAALLIHGQRAVVPI